MKSKKMTLTTHIAGDDGEDLEVMVEATVTGKYIPAKMYGDDAHPEEFPEIVIDTVTDEIGYDHVDDLDQDIIAELEGEIEESLSKEEDEGPDEDEGSDR
jgi:hypothetical protein